jgi:hypothetical protein
VALREELQGLVRTSVGHYACPYVHLNKTCRYKQYVRVKCTWIHWLDETISQIYLAGYFPFQSARVSFYRPTGLLSLILLQIFWNSSSQHLLASECLSLAAVLLVLNSGNAWPLLSMLLSGTEQFYSFRRQPSKLPTSKMFPHQNLY